ncbi:MAG: hypothetical protein JWN08_2609 [Frankiales bacterium]|nr:hypothetical protein [Frankiales bacterium]
MTPPPDAPDVPEGTDVVVDPADLDDAVDTPATSDPDEMVDDGELGGTAGQGGAG